MGFIPGCLVDIYSKLKLPDGNRCSDSFQTGDQIEIGTSETFKKFRSQLATLADVSTREVIYLNIAKALERLVYVHSVPFVNNF